MHLKYFLIGALLSGSALAQQSPYIDKGACLGEGCRYGERWVATRSMELLEAPDATASYVAAVADGQAVRTLTGEVHTVPGRFVVHRPQGEFSPGDEVLVYTYLGEGRFQLRHNGVLKEADLNFGPRGSSNGTRCEKNLARCWGTLEEELKSDWWVKVRTERGQEGWVLGPKGFKTPMEQ